MEFRPCIDIHNGSVKTDRWQQSVRSGRLCQRKFCVGAGCSILCKAVQPIRDQRRTCDPAQ